MIRVSQTGARPSNCRSIGRRNTRQSAGCRTTTSVASRANRRPSDSAEAHRSTRIRSSRPGLTPNISAALPPLIAIATFRYESS